MSCWRRFAFWFAAEAVLYGLVVANGRAYNQANYAATVVTDMLISAFNFWVAAKFIDNKDNRDAWSFAGCVAGGATGSVLSILVTKVLYGA